MKFTYEEGIQEYDKLCDVLRIPYDTEPEELIKVFEKRKAELASLKQRTLKDESWRNGVKVFPMRI